LSRTSLARKFPERPFEIMGLFGISFPSPLSLPRIPEYQTLLFPVTRDFVEGIFNLPAAVFGRVGQDERIFSWISLPASFRRLTRESREVYILSGEENRAISSWFLSWISPVSIIDVTSGITLLTRSTVSSPRSFPSEVMRSITFFSSLSAPSLLCSIFSPF